MVESSEHPQRLTPARILLEELRSGCAVMEFEQPGRLRIPSHAHEGVTIMAPVSGSLVDRMGRRSFPCGPGSILLRPDLAQHSHEYGAGGARCVSIVIPPEMVGAQSPQETGRRHSVRRAGPPAEPLATRIGDRRCRASTRDRSRGSGVAQSRRTASAGVYRGWCPMALQSTGPGDQSSEGRPSAPDIGDTDRAGSLSSWLFRPEPLPQTLPPGVRDHTPKISRPSWPHA